MSAPYIVSEWSEFSTINTNKPRTIYFDPFLRRKKIDKNTIYYFNTYVYITFKNRINTKSLYDC